MEITHLNIQYSRVPDFSELVEEYSGPVIAEYLAQTVPKTRYYARARYGNALRGWFSWGKTIQFTTADVGPSIKTPKTDGTLIWDYPVVLDASKHSDANGTNIQIASDADFENLVWEYDGVYATSVTSENITWSNTYYIRARHKSLSLGWTNWGIVGTFTTADCPASPAITSPPHGSTGQNTDTLKIAAAANTSAVKGLGLQVSMVSSFASRYVLLDYNGAYVTSKEVPEMWPEHIFYSRAIHVYPFGNTPWANTVGNIHYYTTANIDTWGQPSITWWSYTKPTVSLSWTEYPGQIKPHWVQFRLGIDNGSGVSTAESGLIAYGNATSGTWRYGNADYTSSFRVFLAIVFYWNGPDGGVSATIPSPWLKTY